jgi:hypothetical protein
MNAEELTSQITSSQALREGKPLGQCRREVFPQQLEDGLNQEMHQSRHKVAPVDIAEYIDTSFNRT